MGIKWYWNCRISFFCLPLSQIIEKMKKITLLTLIWVMVFAVVPSTLLAQEKKTKDEIEQPGYPGGLKAFHKYLISELRFPEEAKHNNNLKEALVAFIIGVDGYPTSVRILRTSGSNLLDKEIIRVIGSSGYWYPGKKNGKPIRFDMSMPLNCKVLFDHDKYINEEEDGSTVNNNVLKEIF